MTKSMSIVLLTKVLLSCTKYFDAEEQFLVVFYAVFLFLVFLIRSFCFRSFCSFGLLVSVFLFSVFYAFGLLTVRSFYFRSFGFGLLTRHAAYMVVSSGNFHGTGCGGKSLEFQNNFMATFLIFLFF